MSLWLLIDLPTQRLGLRAEALYCCIAALRTAGGEGDDLVHSQAFVVSSFSKTMVSC
jgi:hypothetical protein